MEEPEYKVVPSILYPPHFALKYRINSADGDGNYSWGTRYIGTEAECEKELLKLIARDIKLGVVNST